MSSGSRAKRYVLCPGPVLSISDGDEHYITASMLKRLYRLPPTAHCVAETDPGFVRTAVDEYLRPRYYGDYPDIAGCSLPPSDLAR